MDTLQALRVAAAVVRAGSFSGAARQIGVTPAAVAKQVAQLETRLGLRVFHRNTHHLSVTEDGQRLLERVQGPLQALHEALDVDRPDRAAHGIVKVSVPATFARMAVLPRLAEFQARFPDVQVDLRLENRRVDLVAEGYDCAIGASLEPDSTLVARTLVSLRPILCASPGYLAAHGEPAGLADLTAHRCIVQRSDISGRLRDWPLTGPGRTHRFVPAPSLVLSDPESAAAAAVAGCGIALVGSHHVARAIADGGLVRVLKAFHGPRFQIAVYYAKRRLLPPRTRAFVDHVLATVPTIPDLAAVVV